MLSRSVVSSSLWPHGLQPARLLCPWGFSRQEYWSGLPCLPPGESSQAGDQSEVSRTVGRFFTIWATRETQEYWVSSLSLLQGILLTQESNWGLLHCRWILYQLSCQAAVPQMCQPCSASGPLHMLFPAWNEPSVASHLLPVARPSGHGSEVTLQEGSSWPPHPHWVSSSPATIYYTILLISLQHYCYCKISCVFFHLLYIVYVIVHLSCFLLPLPSTRRSPAQLLAQTGLDKYFSAYIHIFAFMWNMRPLRQIRNHSQRQ